MVVAEELAPGAVRREDLRTVLLVSAVLTVQVPVTGQTPVDTDARVGTLDLPVGAVVVPALRLVLAVTAVHPPVTAPPLVHTGPVTAGDVTARAGRSLATASLVTAVSAVQPAVTELAGQHTQPLVNTLKLAGQTGQAVGPVAWLDCVQTADLVSLVLTVGHSVAAQTEADAGSIVAAELVPTAAHRTVQLIIRAVGEPVTALTEGETGPVTAEELCPTAGSLAPGLIGAVPAVLPSVTAREVRDAGPVLLAPEVCSETGPVSPALSAVEDRDLPASLALRHLLHAEVAVAHSVLPAHRAAAVNHLDRERGGGGG